MLDALALEAFAAIAEEGHFARAADRLGVAQSVVSKRLQRLEDQLGMRLVSRGRRSTVALTREGEEFLAHARTALEALSRAERQGGLIARGEAGSLRVGYVLSAVFTGVLPRLAGALAAALPHLDIDPASMTTPEQLAGLEKGTLDIAIVRPRPAYPPGTQAMVVHREEIIVGLAADDPLARKKTLSAADVAGRPIIVPQFSEEIGLIEIVRDIVRAGKGASPDIVRTPDYITAAGLAASGRGLVVAPRSLARLHLEGFAYRDFSDLKLDVALVLVMRAGLSSPLRRRIAALMQDGL